MSELTIRRNRGLAAPQYQGIKRAEKQAGSSAAGRVTEKTGLAVSGTLRQLMSRAGQAESGTRESRRALQMGESILGEVKESLERLALLAKESAEGNSPDRAALQTELEQLRDNIDRMLNCAVSGDTPLFLDGEPDLDSDKLAVLYLGAVIAGGSPEHADPAQALEGLVQLLEKLHAGVPMDQAIQELTGGVFTGLADLQAQLANGTAPGLDAFLAKLLPSDSASALTPDSLLPTLLEGMEGMNLELLMDLLTAGQGAKPEPGISPEGAARTEVPSTMSPPASSARLGDFQVSGTDLSGVSFNSSTGQLTVSGRADVVIRGAGQEGQSILLTGSGTVTLQNVSVPSLTVSAEAARLFTAGESQLGQVLLEQGASLTLDGGALLKLSSLRGDASNLLRLTGGAVEITGEAGKNPEALTVPVVVEGLASLAGRAVSVTNAGGQPLEPLDLVWKTLLPGWSGLTSMELDGKQARLALMNGDPVRLWLAKGDPSHGYPIHGLILRGKDAASDHPRTRYSYLRWNQQTRRFQEVSVYPNPFSVTGGQAGLDWVYEEESQTLRILSNQVTAISGGLGTDVNQEPFSGRIALADHIGAMELTLEDVVCRVEEGRAFDLGQGNDVTLFLLNGTSSLFESGLGCSGISLGDGTTLNIDCVKPRDGGEPNGILTATGGTGSAGIGWDSDENGERTGHILIRGGGGSGGRQGFTTSVTIVGGLIASTGGGEGGVNRGISLQMGEDAVTMPQFRLSSRTLRLDRLSVLTREYARAAQEALDADLRWVARVQDAYGALQEQSYGALTSVCRYIDEKRRLVRDTDSASTLLEDMQRSILCQPGQALLTHGGRASEDVQNLLE